MAAKHNENDEDEDDQELDKLEEEAQLEETELLFEFEVPNLGDHCDIADFAPFVSATRSKKLKGRSHIHKSCEDVDLEHMLEFEKGVEEGKC